MPNTSFQLGCHTVCVKRRAKTAKIGIETAIESCGKLLSDQFRAQHVDANRVSRHGGPARYVLLIRAAPSNPYRVHHIVLWTLGPTGTIGAPISALYTYTQLQLMRRTVETSTSLSIARNAFINDEFKEHIGFGV